jgi:PTS system cellobiose-specific IIB component
VIRALIVCFSGASSTFLASKMRSAARARNIEIDIAVVALSELASKIGEHFSGFVLVGPHMAADFDLIASRVSSAGGAALLLPHEAAGPAGADKALDLVISFLNNQIHTNKGTLRA